MRRDESIYLIGEEVAEYNGAKLKLQKEMLDEFGPKIEKIDAPYCGIRICRNRCGFYYE